MQIGIDSRTVEAQYVEMMVPLYSNGCVRKIKKAVSNLKGIYSVDVDKNQQKVIVWGICDKCDVLMAVRSKRKDARFWSQNECELLSEPELVSKQMLHRSVTWEPWKRIVEKLHLNRTLTWRKMSVFRKFQH